MDRNTMIKLIENISWLVENGGFAFKNATAPLIRTHIQIMTQKLLALLPGYSNRIKEIQELNSQKMIRILSGIAD